jgi:hypothetical protein
MQAPHDRDASGHRRSGITTLVEVRDVVAHPLRGDIVEPEVLILEPSEIAVEIVGVGVEGAG